MKVYFSAILISLTLIFIGCETDDNRMDHNMTDQMRDTNHALNQVQGEADFSEAAAVLYPTEGSKVKGTVTFTKTNDGIMVKAEIDGLTPGKHGFHIHEFGDCSAADGSSAGGHFNPENQEHAGPDAGMRHTGDMGNIEADQNGKAVLEYVDKEMSFTGPSSIIGRGIIVHEKEDDLKTQPTGNAGGRLACGVIGITKK